MCNLFFQNVHDIFGVYVNMVVKTMLLPLVYIRPCQLICLDTFNLKHVIGVRNTNYIFLPYK